MKITNKIKAWLKSRKRLNEMTWTRYKLYITFNDGEEIEIEIELRNYSCWDNFSKFLELELYDRKTIKAPNGIYYDTKNIKTVKPEILDQITLLYKCEVINILYNFGSWATKEEIEEWNERMLSKYGRL